MLKCSLQGLQASKCTYLVGWCSEILAGGVRDHKVWKLLYDDPSKQSTRENGRMVGTGETRRGTLAEGRLLAALLNLSVL